MAKNAKTAADKELDDLVSALGDDRLPYANHACTAPAPPSYKKLKTISRTSMATV